jgi:hypothetical protein
LITGVAVNASVDGKAKFIKSEKIDENHYPLLEGSYSVPFSYSNPKFESYINYDKKLEKIINNEFDKNYFETKGSHQRPFNLRKIEDFDRPKVFIRQSDVKVTATYSEKLLFGNYSLFTMYHNKNDNKFLKATLGIINSKLLSFYAIKKEIVLLKTGKTPQLRSGQRGPIGLRQLPLVFMKIGDKNFLELKTDRILAAKAKDPSADTSSLESEIDQLVYQLYGLTEEEIAIVEKS